MPQNEACPLLVNLTCNGGGNIVSFDAIEFITWISCWNELDSKSKCWEPSWLHVSCLRTEMPSLMIFYSQIELSW